MNDIITIKNLDIEIRQEGKRLHVLKDINASIKQGYISGLVGESGAGKSMIAKAILGLLPSGAHILNGEIHYQGQNLLSLRKRDHRKLLGKHIALIPQDPMVSLNPVRRIGEQMIDGLRLHLGLERNQARINAQQALADVLIKEPDKVMKAYAHEISGGMRQRVLIAMAFSSGPDLIIADEPTTALDVTVQKRVLQLIKSLQTKTRTSLIFVTHDLGVVSKICNDVYVMQDGCILEHASVRQLFDCPAHPYTRRLLESVPRYDDPAGHSLWATE